MPNHSIIYEESTSLFVPINGEDSRAVVDDDGLTLETQLKNEEQGEDEVHEI